MINPFKFLSNDVLLTSHDGHPIRCDDWFYSVNKKDMISPRFGRVIPKYTIVTRIIHKRFRFKFKPDHEALWYFKLKENAYCLIDISKGMDKLNEWELKQRRRRTR